MSRVEVFPKELLFPGRVDGVIDWLLKLDIPFLERKELLCDWCSYTGYPLTKELVDRLGREG
jgi:hypothetical protein